MRIQYMFLVEKTNKGEKAPILNLQDRINSWAEDGWEYVHSYYSPAEPGYVAVLKRRIYC